MSCNSTICVAGIDLTFRTSTIIPATVFATNSEIGVSYGYKMQGWVGSEERLVRDISTALKTGKHDELTVTFKGDRLEIRHSAYRWEGLRLEGLNPNNQANISTHRKISQLQESMAELHRKMDLLLLAVEPKPVTKELLNLDLLTSDSDAWASEEK